jgi:RNA polymerase sigma-70 factor (ECF subfamily)
MLVRCEATATAGAGAALPDCSAPAGGLAREKPLKPSGETAADIRGLTIAVRRGDPDAFARFYDLYSFRLYKFLLVLTHGDEEEAREVCQAVFIKLTRRFEVSDDEASLWHWLSKLGKNAFIDAYRAKRRRGRLIPLEEMPPGIEPEVIPPQLLSELLREALASVPPEERELLQAAYIDEQPIRQLAEESGQTYKAMEHRLARLRQKLKAQMLKNLRHEHDS